jgi:putative sugar O-methyltransferase
MLERRSFASILRRMMQDMETAPEIVQPSKYWQDLNRRHFERLSETGIEDFKRTLAKDYFTWMRVLPWDSQIRFLVKSLPMSAVLKAVVGTFRKHANIPWTESLALNFLTRLIWQYAERQAPKEMAVVSEPEIGNPPDIRQGGRLISQDLANSVLEFQSFADVALGTICELGGGYGRNAFVTSKLGKPCQYIMADIAPALGVAQRYLTSVFPDKRHFWHRSFNDFEAVRKDLAASDFAYLLPHQLAVLPDNSIDLFINISSLHEMRHDQIAYYLKEIHRLVKPGGHFYLKAWKESHIPFENIIVREEDYDLSGWEVVFRRTPAVQTRFFETLLRKA